MAREFSATRLLRFTTIAIATFVLLYLPIATLVIYSYNGNEAIGNWGGFSGRWYVKAWDKQAVQKATWLTLQLASISAILLSIIVTMISAFSRFANGITKSEPFMPEDMQTAFVVIVPEQFRDAGRFIPTCPSSAMELCTAIWTELQN